MFDGWKLRRAAKVTIIAGIMFAIAIVLIDDFQAWLFSNSELIYIFISVLTLVFIFAGVQMIGTIRNNKIERR
jgi:hypothetical protein